MNKNALIDRMSLSIASILLPKSKYFTKGTDSKNISHLLNDIEVDVPQINGEDYYTVQVSYKQKYEEAAFRVEQWKGYGFPTIIYHHGAAEGKYDFSFNRILAKKKDAINANIIALQAVFNHSNKEFMKSIAYLSNYTLMLASSVLIANSLIEQIKRKTEEKVILTGLSLGAFVTNMHFTYFNTASCYVPVLGGARLAEAFLDSAYAKITSKEAKQVPDKIRRVLNFDGDFNKREQNNIYPLLAAEDQIVVYNVHAQDFNSDIIRKIPYGHSTGSTNYKLIREHIITVMESKYNEKR